MIPERRTDAYELLGNSVSVPLIYALLCEVVAQIRRLDSRRAALASVQLAAEARIKGRIVRIRGLLRQRTSSAIDIGHELIEIKDALPHGRFGPWLAENFSFTAATARNWMSVARVFGGRQAEVEAAGVADTALIELVRIPDDGVRDKLLDQALRGEVLTVATIRAEISKAKAASGDTAGVRDLGQSESDVHLTVTRLAEGLERSITQSRVRADAAELARDIAMVTKTVADLAVRLDQGQKRVLTSEDKKILESTIGRLNARIGHLTSRLNS